MKANNFLQKLDESTINYRLLRPIQIENSNDIDLFIKSNEIKELKMFLYRISNNIYWRKTNSRKSVKIILNDSLVLDIQFTLSFLPYKLFQLPSRFDLSESKLNISDKYVFPNIIDEQQFSIWANRLLLDKKNLKKFSSLDQFKVMHGKNFNQLVNSIYFENITVFLFGNSNLNSVKNDISLILSDKAVNLQQKYTKLLYRKHKYLYIIKLIFESKYKIERRLGVYKKKRDLRNL